MQFFGYEVTFRKAPPPSLSPVSDLRGGWWPVLREPFAGAWQRNIEWTTDTVLAHHAVYSCITLIANDVAKLRIKLVEQGANGIWSEISSASFSPVLRRPNHFQNRIQFIAWWITSKLVRGNTYVLKQRDARGVVVGLYILDPSRIQVLVSPTGDVFYSLQQDNLSGVQELSIAVPAREIIHDRINCLFHPLVGTSPLFAAGMAAHVGITVEQNSAGFFANGSNPAGVLSSVASISPQKAAEYSERWDAQFSGPNSGGVAVLGDGMKFEPMRMTAVDSQMIEHLKWSAEVCCSAFHVPAFKVGVGQMPTYSNGEILDQRYYSDCLQSHIEQLELCLDEGLGLTEVKGRTLGVEMDLDGLWRMDTATQIEALAKSVGGGIHAPNEARRKLDLPPTKGGDTPYLQQQNYSLAALDERDKKGPPPGTPAPPAPKPPPDDADQEKAALALELDTFTLTLRAA